MQSVVLLAALALALTGMVQCVNYCEGGGQTGCTETEAACLARLTAEGKKSVADVRTDCCVFRMSKNNTTPIMAREACCFETRTAMGTSPICAEEICFFERVEEEVRELRNVLVFEKTKNGLESPDEFTELLNVLDGFLGKLWADEVFAQRELRTKSFKRDGFLTPWYIFAQNAAKNLLEAIVVGVKAQEPDPTEARISLDNKYRLLFITLQRMGFEYDAIREIRHREARLLEWQARLKWTNRPQFVVPVPNTNPSNLPEPSSLDLFTHQVAARQKALSGFTERRLEQERPGCREMSIGRPTPDDLKYSKSRWKTSHEHWFDREMTRELKDLRVWRSDILAKERNFMARLRAIGKGKPGVSS